MSALSILDVQHLTKTYDTGAGKLTVLKDVSFILPAASTCSILGPSGSGKTTLLGLCAGLDRLSRHAIFQMKEELMPSRRSATGSCVGSVPRCRDRA